MSEIVTSENVERRPIWARYTNEPTDRKCEQIERALTNAGASFAVHVAPGVSFGDVDWTEDGDGIWIEAYIPAHKAERTVSELRCCGCIAGVGEADWNSAAA
jgi:hypothetical protein